VGLTKKTGRDCPQKREEKAADTTPGWKTVKTTKKWEWSKNGKKIGGRKQARRVW